MSLSQVEKLAGLEPERRAEVLEGFSDAELEAFEWDWESWARPAQLEPEGDHRVWLVLAGRGYGKTRIGAEWIRKQVQRFELVNMIGATTDDIRDIMVEGESGIMACCPRWERPVFRPSLMRLDWPNGAKTLYFTAEQPERLRGKQHMRLWADELASWQYVDDTWDMAVLGLRLGDDPRALITTTPKPIPLLREMIQDPTVSVTKGRTYDNRSNLAPQFFSQLIAKYEGTRLGRQELEAELLLDEGLAYSVVAGVHLVPPFEIPAWWGRFEAMDYGSTAPTAWGAFSVDTDGNVVLHDMYYKPGLVADHAAAIHRLRRSWRSSVCYAPPDIKTRFPRRDTTGREMSVETEFADHGISFVAAQNDRRAGYQRVAEMLRRVEGRRFPDWHPYSQLGSAGGSSPAAGAPRLFIVDSPATQPLVEQLRNAPLENEESAHSRFPGEAVDQDWEHTHGHAHAMLRYGLMSRPLSSVAPIVEPADPRAALLWRYENKRDRGGARKRNYDW